MYIGKYKYTSKTILPIIFAFALGLFSIIFITQSFLAEHYHLLVGYLSIKFQVFLIYEIFVAIFYLFFVIFSFGFVNFITKEYNQLNKIFPVIVFCLLLMSFFNFSIKTVLIVLLMSLPTLFFRKIVNVARSIWSLYFLLLILNIIFNTTIIKLSL
ncbi:MAG: hypothetical protein KAT32_00265 [Candidatus Moranbacteria bacterium]|nr:hypothetical protein [Candidatus Moranbacteria bacterium]